jgi:hypothetical protein
MSKLGLLGSTAGGLRSLNSNPNPSCLSGNSSVHGGNLESLVTLTFM